MTDIMDSAVLNAQFEMAMSDELSRAQFYWRARSVLRERDSLKAQIASAQQQEPVGYQYYHADSNFPWINCTKVYADFCSTNPRYRSRKLYAAPVIPQIALPAAPDAPVLPSGLVGWFVYEENCWVATSSDWPGATKLYRAPVIPKVALPRNDREITAECNPCEVCFSNNCNGECMEGFSNE